MGGSEKGVNSVMDIKKMTDKQKYWYMMGYMNCFVVHLSIDYNITEKEARQMLIDILSQRLNIKV